MHYPWLHRFHQIQIRTLEVVLAVLARAMSCSFSWGQVRILVGASSNKRNTGSPWNLENVWTKWIPDTMVVRTESSTQQRSQLTAKVCGANHELGGRMVSDKVKSPTMRFHKDQHAVQQVRVYRHEKRYIQAKCVTYGRSRVHSQRRAPICRRSTAVDTLERWLELKKVFESHSNKPSLFQGLQRSPMFGFLAVFQICFKITSCDKHDQTWSNMCVCVSNMSIIVAPNPN